MTTDPCRRRSREQTVVCAIGGPRNAGLLAVRILASGESQEATRLAAAMRAFQKDLGEVAHAKGAALRERVQG